MLFFFIHLFNYDYIRIVITPTHCSEDFLCFTVKELCQEAIKNIIKNNPFEFISAVKNKAGVDLLYKKSYKDFCIPIYLRF